MKQVVKEVGIPIFSIEMDFSECRFDTTEEIVTFLVEQVKSHKAARYITTFDHLKHTSELAEGIVAEHIVAAYNIVFCFGFSLQGAEQLATRPRSLGVCETDNRVTLSFMEAPMPVANALMEQWTRSLLSDERHSSQHAASQGRQEDLQLHS
ncbi:MAG: DUF6858 family protein [Candidatus Thiodiazotropha sp.]